MKRIYFWILSTSLLVLVSCGAEITESNHSKDEQNYIDLKEYGLNAEILLQSNSIRTLEIESNYDQQLLRNKKIEIESNEGYLLTLVESQENAVEMKVEFAEGFGEEVVEKGGDFCVIKQMNENDEPIYDVSVFIENNGVFIEVKILDLKTQEGLKSIELVKKGLESARSLRFK